MFTSRAHAFWCQCRSDAWQWKFQIGYRGLHSESADPLTVSDHFWLARWLLYRLGEKFNINASLDPKTIKGDWNGAGMKPPPIQHFSSGIANRQASIRIPNSVAEQGYDYIEDRRPGANADPYQVSAKLLETICKIKRPI